MAINDSFLLGLAGVVVAFVATLFLTELPLQKRYAHEEPGEVVPAGLSPETDLTPANPESAQGRSQQPEQQADNPD